MGKKPKHRSTAEQLNEIKRGGKRQIVSVKALFPPAKYQKYCALFSLISVIFIQL
jgi:hypothetical protein